tara:strand:+ start:18531 stop:20744 length:2214 start_codon:yes stop_codon:yes gene_type:complete
MALVVKDRIKETSSTTGQGTLTLGGAVDGFLAFGDANAGIGDGNTTFYVIVDGNNFETGIGTYTSSGNTLSRDTVLTSSATNRTDKISCTGSQEVFVSQPADKAFYLDNSLQNNLAINGTDNYNISTTGYASFTGNIFSAGGLTLTDSGNNPTITFREHSQIDPKAQIVGAEVDTDNGTLVFKTQNATTMTTALTIDQTQNATFAGTVNIGTTGSLSNNSGTFLIDANTNLNFRGGTQTFDNADGSVEYMRLNSTGLGIGEANPDRPLHITASATPIVRFTGNGSNQADYPYAEIEFENADDSGSAFTVDASIVVRSSESNGNGGQLCFHTGVEGSSERVRINEVGCVGIGTQDPAYALDINGGSFTKSSIRLTRTDSGQDNDPGLYFVNNAGANDDWGMGGIWFSNSLDGNAYSIIRCRTDDSTGTSGKLEFVTGQSTVGNSTDPRMLIESNGEIGINTTSPTNYLHVHGGSEAPITISGASTRTGIFLQQPGTSTVRGSVLTLADQTFRLGTASHYHIEMQADGKTCINTTGNNVGIGTDSPTEILEIKTSSSPTIELNQADTYKGAIRLAGNDLELRNSSGQMDFFVGTDNDHDNNNVRALVIDTDSTSDSMVGVSGVVTDPNGWRHVISIGENNPVDGSQNNKGSALYMYYNNNGTLQKNFVGAWNGYFGLFAQHANSIIKFCTDSNGSSRVEIDSSKLKLMSGVSLEFADGTSQSSAGVSAAKSIAVSSITF